MYSLLALAALVFGAVLAVPNPERCEVSGWGPWGQCVRSPPCPNPKQIQSKSFPKAPATEDVGRAKMRKMMAEKERQRLERGKCRAEGTCPELAFKPSSGPMACSSGMAGEYPCLNVDLVYYLNITDLGYTPTIIQDPVPEANDVWGWTDPENGYEYVIQGVSGGSSFVRISPDPTNPTVLGFLPSRAGSPVIWRDMKVIGNYVFIVSECSKHGMQVVDMTRFRGVTEFQGEITADAEYGLFGNAHNIAANVDTDYLYVIGATDRAFEFSCSGGLHVIDVKDPLNPTYAGCFPIDGYVHDTQCVVYHGPDPAYNGREICFCFNEDTLTIVDVQDKSNMQLISKSGYTGYGYTHQGWLTEDHTIVLLDDELDELENPPYNGTRTYMWDVTSLADPELKLTYYSSEPSSDHNQYVLKDYVYQSNYMAGLRILRIDQENYSLQEYAFFDNFPSSNAPGFQGSWSNYPYFASGVIPVSCIDYGLYLVRPNWPAIRQAVAENKAHAEQSRSRKVEVYTNGADCPMLGQSRPCKAPSC